MGADSEENELVVFSREGWGSGHIRVLCFWNITVPSMYIAVCLSSSREYSRGFQFLAQEQL